MICDHSPCSLRELMVLIQWDNMAHSERPIHTIVPATHQMVGLLMPILNELQLGIPPDWDRLPLTYGGGRFWHRWCSLTQPAWSLPRFSWKEVLTDSTSLLPCTLPINLTLMPAVFLQRASGRHTFWKLYFYFIRAMHLLLSVSKHNRKKKSPHARLFCFMKGEVIQHHQGTQETTSKSNLNLSGK